MGSVRRIYVEKKQPYAVHAKELKEEVKRYLGIKSINNVRVLIRYDVENLSDATYKQALGTVFSEPPVDNCYENEFKKANGSFVFSVEYLPGQFDQRADSAEQCVKLLNEKENPVIRSATTYVFEGDIDDQDKEKIKEYCINPVDSREASENIPETLVQEFDEPADVAIFDGFRQMSEDELKKLYESLNLAMTFKDFLHIQNYFKNEENREPSVTEIRVLDTYWSDHCRHTTFQTELKNVKFEDGYYNAPIEASYEMYEAARKELFKDRPDKYVSLMDIALMGMRKLKADGKLDDMEESDEINACSIVVPVEIDGKTEEWYAVAVTYGPGLVGALLVGTAEAKAIAYAAGKPLVGVHHIEGHIAANYIENQDLEPPFMCLIVSGGHTHLVVVEDYDKFNIIGRTRDDAAGEAFDKVARSIGLGYPGGPKIDKAAKLGNPDAITFPKAKMSDNPYDFSFSGLKSAVLNYLNHAKMTGEEVNPNDLAASFQKAVVQVLVEHAIRGTKEHGFRKLALAGGVASNSALRASLKEACEKNGITLYYPSPIFCTDNAAMIGAAGYYEYKKGRRSGWDLNAAASLKLGER